MSMQSSARSTSVNSGAPSGVSRHAGANPAASNNAFCSRKGRSSAAASRSTISRLGAVRPLSRKLTCRWEISATWASASCDMPRRWRHHRSREAKLESLPMITCHVVDRPGRIGIIALPSAAVKERAVARAPGRRRCDPVERRGRRRRGGDALSDRERRSIHARRVAVRWRRSLPAADRARAAGALAGGPEGPVAGRRARLAVLRSVLRVLQFGARLHHGGARLGIEALSTRKTIGVVVAMLGVAAALASGLGTTLPGAWRGDLIMTGATFCMALYNVWSRPFIARSSALGFLTAGMLAGAAALVLISWLSGDFARVSAFTLSQWAAALYLAAGGGALAFFLWVWALQHASPTRVANAMTVNPIVAGLLAAGFLGEPMTLNLFVGLMAVFAGVWIATMEGSASR